MKNALLGLLLLCMHPLASFSQNDSSAVGKIVSFPSRLLSRIQRKTTSLDQQLTANTSSYLEKMARHEAKLYKKLSAIDSAGARKLFANSAATYSALQQKIRTDTGSAATPFKAQYNPYTDSLRTSLAFLAKEPSLAQNAAAQQASGDLQKLQAKMQDAGAIQTYLSQRKQQISQYLSQYTSPPAGLTKEYQGLTQDLYYYKSQVSQYQAMLSQPDQLEEKALSQLNQVPAFRNFMHNNSQLNVLFGQSANPNSGSPAALAGLQTRDQIGKLVQGQLPTDKSGGSGSSAALQANVQGAQQQLDQLKSRLDKYGAGGEDMDIPNFQPNDQKTKTFWKRLQFGTDLQTTSSTTYFPTITDLGLSLGYRLNGANTVGVGASFKLGWGSGIQHISLSGEGAGLRSFLNIGIKNGFSATGGLEYNYTTPIVSLQQIRSLSYWTQSGLVGLSKTVSLKNRVVKQTRLSLLWDFLSYYQTPRTQAFLFRVGYNF